VRRSSRSTRSAAPRAAIVGVLATCVSLLACGVAAASITLFEPPLFHPGSVNAQSGVGGFPWKSAPVGAIPACVPTPTNGQYDQSVVANSVAPPGEPPGFGSQSLRMSNACASSEFSNQTYSAQELQQVGEQRPNRVFLAEFAFMSTTAAHQPGLFLSVSPDSGEGSRMSWVGLEDTADGIRISVNDTPDVDGKFVAHPGPLLGRGSPHRIRFWIKVNPGIDNDLVRIFNERGEVHCAVQVLPTIRAGTVSLPKGLWRRSTRNGATATALAPDTLSDLGAGACFNDARVEVASLPHA